MPRFFFDVTAGDAATVDPDGVELPGRREAEQEALAALGEIAKDALGRGDLREVAIAVRDGSPEPILTVNLVAHLRRTSG